MSTNYDGSEVPNDRFFFNGRGRYKSPVGKRRDSARIAAWLSGKIGLANSTAGVPAAIHPHTVEAPQPRAAVLNLEAAAQSGDNHVE